MTSAISSLGASNFLSGSTGASPVVTDEELESTFQKAVAGLFFSQMMKSLRSTVGEPAYLHGGQAERMFEAQLDQVLVEDLSETKGSAFIGELYRQFRVQLGLPPEPAAPPINDGLNSAPPPAKSPQSVGSPVPEEPLHPLHALEAVRQARSDTERFLGTTPTAVFSGLFRK